MEREAASLVSWAHKEPPGNCLRIPLLGTWAGGGAEPPSFGELGDIDSVDLLHYCTPQLRAHPFAMLLSAQAWVTLGFQPCALWCVEASPRWARSEHGSYQHAVHCCDQGQDKTRHR